MSRALKALTACSASFPRVSGDEPTGDVTSPDAQLFSPRERG